MGMRARIILLMVIGLMLAGLATAESGPGLSQKEGVLYLEGKPYRGVGANYFDLFIRLLHDPNDTTSLEGLERLGKAGIPFVRFGVAYSAKDWALFYSDREEFFRRFDRVVRAAERARVGLIPSIFWNFMIFPDMAGEPRDQWGNPASRTQARMREVTGAIVERYKGSPALWAWEFGNEPNLAADLPNAVNFRKKGGTERDDLKSGAMVTMLTEFAKEVRRHDARRLIIAGHSHPRASAWHNSAEKSWKPDTREQTMEILKRDNPEPYDSLGIHVYADKPVPKEMGAWAADHTEYLRAVRGLARELKRPLFVGEFGLAAKGDAAAETRAKFEKLLGDLEAADVDLAAFWVYDLKNQKEWTVTFENARAYMLELAAQASRRWLEKAGGGNH